LPFRLALSRRISADGLKTVAQALLCSHFFCSFFVYLGHYYRKTPTSIPAIWEGVGNGLLNPWMTYDPVYYLTIAKVGYQNITSLFFPLYPLLLLHGGDSQIGMAIFGIVISNLAFAAALYFLYRLTEMDYGHKAAPAAGWLLAFFPMTAFFSAVYTESTFLLLLLLCFYSARQHQWMIGGLSGALASLCRNPGVLISDALALEYLRDNEEVVSRIYVGTPVLATRQEYDKARFQGTLGS
jgi:Gpi18-like mannosyltransferase